jgi:ABC-type Fe3+ transport system permease subunit
MASGLNGTLTELGNSFGIAVLAAFLGGVVAGVMLRRTRGRRAPHPAAGRSRTVVRGRAVRLRPRLRDRKTRVDVR